MPLEFNNPTLSDNLQASRLTVQDHRVIEIENLRGPSQDVHNFLTYAHATLRINGVVFAVAGTSLHVLRCSPQVEIGDMVLIDSVTMTPTEPGVAWNFEAVPQERTTSAAPYGYSLLRTAGRYRSSVARGTDREALLAVAGATDVAQELIPLVDHTQRLTNTAVDGELVGYASRMFRGRQSVVDSQEPISEVTLPVANIVVGGDTQYVATGLVGYPARGEIFIDELHGTAMSVSRLCARRWLEWRINNHVMSSSREWAVVDYELDDDPDSDDDILYNVVITAGPIPSMPTTPVEGPTGVPYAEHLTAAERIDAEMLTQYQNMRSRLIAITREHYAEYRDCSGNLGWAVWHESTRKFACVRRSGMVVQWQDKAAYIMPSRAAAERLIHREGRGIAVRVPRPLITYSATFNEVQVLDGPDVYRHNTGAMPAVLVGYTQSTAYWQARYLSQDLWLHAVETYHAEEQTALIQGCREHILFSLRAHPTIYRIIPTEYTASEVYWSDNPFRLEINREMRRHQRQGVEYVPRQPTSHRRQLDLS